MTITKVEIFLNPTAKDDKLKAYATLVIDHAFKVRDLKIIKGLGRLFVAMPNKRLKGGEYQDIAYPVDEKARELVESAVLGAYLKLVGVEI